jgi:hypothetical protein
MKLDFAIFEPKAVQRAIIETVAAFCESLREPFFTVKQLIADPNVRSVSSGVKSVREWLKPGRRLVVLGNLLLLHE